MAYTHQLEKLHLKDAFKAAANVQAALERGVKYAFEMTGAYEATDPYGGGSFGLFLGMGAATLLTLGGANKVYKSLSMRHKAVADDYRKDTAKHVKCMAEKLKDAVKKLPQSEEKTALEAYLQKANFAFYMERAALSANDSKTFKRGLKHFGKARHFASDAAVAPLEKAYHEGSFPGRGSFAAETAKQFEHGQFVWQKPLPPPPAPTPAPAEAPYVPPAATEPPKKVEAPAAPAPLPAKRWLG